MSDPDRSDRQIAKAVGCHNETVASVRAELVSTDGIRQSPALLGADGRWYNNKRATTDPGTSPAEPSAQATGEAKPPR